MKKVIVIVLFFGFALGFAVSSSFGDDAYEKLKIMIDVMELIDQKHVDKKDTKDMVSGAIRGIVSTLDPFSQYMEEKAFKEVQTETKGSFGGVGIQIAIKNDYITVISPMPDTPAYKAGILPGDKIFKIDGKSAYKMDTAQAVSLMKGKYGTKVTLTMLRDGTPEPIVFVLKRDNIKIVTVRGAILEGDIAYIRFSEFNAQGAKDIQKILEDFSKQTKLKGIVLDMRNNPGGLVNTAVDIISMFIKGKEITLTTRGRNKVKIEEYKTSGDVLYPDVPMVILLNRGSASASEIVSGSLQDFKRALIIGANSFGKGSVQQIIPLADGTALRLTIAKYYLPSGRPITRSEEPNDRNGITPDIEINLPIEDEVRLYMQANMIFVGDKNVKVEVISKAQAQAEAAVATSSATVAVSSPVAKVETKGKAKDKVELKPEIKIIKLEDDVLKKAIDVIKENKVKELINSSKALDADKAIRKKEQQEQAEAEKKHKEEEKQKQKDSTLEINNIEVK
jgi:carboxyl-terminal processing protease